MCSLPRAEWKGRRGDGKKLRVRNLGSADVQGQSNAQIIDIISKGKDNMPAFDGKLTKEQIGQVVIYIRELGNSIDILAILDRIGEDLTRMLLPQQFI